MRLIISFIPFFSYLLVERLAGNEPGLIIGLASSICLIFCDQVIRRSAPKLLEVAVAALFLLIWGYVHFTSSDPSVIQVRLALDFGLFVIAAGSVALKKPFTAQYARESAAPQFWNTPEFCRKNVVLSSIWSAAFLALVFADLLFLYTPEVPRAIPMFITVGSLVSASRYTTEATAEASTRGVLR